MDERVKRLVLWAVMLWAWLLACAGSYFVMKWIVLETGEPLDQKRLVISWLLACVVVTGYLARKVVKAETPAEFFRRHKERHP